jgi:hypothetical protein
LISELTAKSTSFAQPERHALEDIMRGTMAVIQRFKKNRHQEFHSKNGTVLQISKKIQRFPHFCWFRSHHKFIVCSCDRHANAHAMLMPR